MILLQRGILCNLLLELRYKSQTFTTLVLREKKWFEFTYPVVVQINSMFHIIIELPFL